MKVVEPNLREVADGKRVPHLFSQEEQTLCLHYHGSWRPHELIAKTIVPLVLLWTEYFEWWLVTGRWAEEEVAHTACK